MAEKLAPSTFAADVHHNRTGEDNGDAHHKRQIMGREVVVAVTGGKLISDRGTDLLRRVRRPPAETSACESDRRIDGPREPEDDNAEQTRVLAVDERRRGGIGDVGGFSAEDRPGVLAAI